MAQIKFRITWQIWSSQLGGMRTRRTAVSISSAIESVSQRRKCMRLMVLPIHPDRKEPKK